jgi:phage tail-like protein
MARRAVDDLQARHSLLRAIPSVYRDEEFLGRLVEGFDTVLAPVHAVVDDLDAYVDPRTAPPDFLEWVGSWMGLTVNRRWPIQRRREFVARALSVYRWRGTTRGIEEAVELYTGIRPQVTDTGGVSASPDPLGSLPGRASPRVDVVVHTAGASIDADLVDRIVADVKPVHVAHSVRIVEEASP